MSGHRNYRELRERVRSNPERRRRIEEIGKAYDTLLALVDLREQRGITQVELADTLDVSQPNVSKLERQADPKLSTLSNYVEALGGHLELKAVFPDQTVNLAPSPASAQ